MKEILLPPSTDYDAMTAVVQREVDIVTALDHPNVIRFYGSSFDQDQHRLLIFMELVSNGSLGGLVRSMKEPMPEKLASIYAAQIVAAVAYIHERNVVHRDLKCDNLLLTEGGQIKLADFGASKAVVVGASGTAGAQTLIGTPFFMAPEMLNAGDGPDDGYGRRADVWSLGITVLEMINMGRVPWPDFPSVNGAIMHIASEDGLPIIPGTFSDELRDFLGHCCCRDPRARYTSAQLLAHPWIARASLSSGAFDTSVVVGTTSYEDS
jgi:serine/threonine protein kinase